MLHRRRRVLVVLLSLLALVCAAHAAALPSLWRGSGDTASTALMRGDREQQIAFWEREVQQLRHTDLQRAHTKLYEAKAALDQARKKEGILYTRAEDKATIRILDEQFQHALVELQQLKSQESAMLAKLKPLYGVVSTQFAQEQKRNIASAIATVQKMSYDNAWWSSLFNLGEAESLGDVLAGFVIEWLVGYVLMYPFALAYYALWTAPWSVYAYVAGVRDVVPALCAYVTSVAVMCAPLAALVTGVYLLLKRYRVSLDEAMERTRMRGRRRGGGRGGASTLYYHTD